MTKHTRLIFNTWSLTLLYIKYELISVYIVSVSSLLIKLGKSCLVFFTATWMNQKAFLWACNGNVRKTPMNSCWSWWRGCGTLNLVSLLLTPFSGKQSRRFVRRASEIISSGPVFSKAFAFHTCHAGVCGKPRFFLQREAKVGAHSA